MKSKKSLGQIVNIFHRFRIFFGNRGIWNGGECIIASRGMDAPAFFFSTPHPHSASIHHFYDCERKQQNLCLLSNSRSAFRKGTFWLNRFLNNQLHNRYWLFHV